MTLKTKDPTKIQKMFGVMKQVTKAIIKNSMELAMQTGNIAAYHTVLLRFSPLEMQLISEINEDTNKAIERAKKKI